MESKMPNRGSRQICIAAFRVRIRVWFRVQLVLIGVLSCLRCQESNEIEDKKGFHFQWVYGKGNEFDPRLNRPLRFHR